MTTTATLKPGTPRPLLRTTAHLAALGIIGPVVFWTWFAVAITGLGGLLAAGVGVLLLIVAAFGLWWIAAAEESRVSGLYRLGTPPRRMPRSPRTDVWRWPHTAWLQVVDRNNLRSVVHFVIASVLGFATLLALQSTIAALAFGIVAAVRPDATLVTPWVNMEVGRGTALAIGAGATVIGLGLIYLMTTVHHAITGHLLIGSREDQLVGQATTANQRRTEAMRAAEVERTRIERDLHDGVQPQLVAIGMTLGMARAKLTSDPDAAAALIDEAHGATKTAITELRQLARGIHPAVLTDRGLDAALSALAARSHIPVHLDVRLSRRCSKEAEAAMYFAVAEALTNAAKHSEASHCRVTVNERPGGMLWSRIEDDGAGGAAQQPGGGLEGVANRVAAVGGTLSVTSPTGGPTTVEVSIPCAS